MEIHQLRTFIMVNEFRSFSKAASELHLTQPAVTLQIKSLEEELGETLIDRFARSLSLTPAGEVFLGYARQIINLTEQAQETIRQFSTTQGRLAIGAGTTNIIFRLPFILQQFHHAYPQIEIRIRSGDSELVTKLVHDNSVDLGLVTTEPAPSLATVLPSRPVFDDQIFLITPPGYPEEISSSRLEKESVILFRSGSGFRRFLEEKFQTHTFRPRVTLELESMEAIIRLVQCGLGLAFLPEIAVIEEVKAGKLQKVGIEGWDPMKRQTFLIYRKDKYLTWPMKTFLQQISEVEPR